MLITNLPERYKHNCKIGIAMPRNDVLLPGGGEWLALGIMIWVPAEQANALYQDLLRFLSSRVPESSSARFLIHAEQIGRVDEANAHATAYKEQIHAQANAPADQGCKMPPVGWWCSRESGHEGPCAARPVEEAPTQRDDGPLAMHCIVCHAKWRGYTKACPRCASPPYVNNSGLKRW